MPSVGWEDVELLVGEVAFLREFCPARPPGERFDPYRDASSKQLRSLPTFVGSCPQALGPVVGGLVSKGLLEGGAGGTVSFTALAEEVWVHRVIGGRGKAVAARATTRTWTGRKRGRGRR